MNLNLYHVKVTFVTELLGTQPQKELVEPWLSEKHAEGMLKLAQARAESNMPLPPLADNGGLPPDELVTLSEELERGTTGFHKQDGNPCLFDYQLMGYLRDKGLSLSGKVIPIKALRSKIERYLVVRPRIIPLHLPHGKALAFHERPLRAQTAQGARVALARSEMAPVGTWFEAEIGVLPSEITESVLHDLLDAGVLSGMLQWRNGGWGRFTYTLSAQGDLPVGEWYSGA